MNDIQENYATLWANMHAHFQPRADDITYMIRCHQLCRKTRNNTSLQDTKISEEDVSNFDDVRPLGSGYLIAPFVEGKIPPEKDLANIVNDAIGLRSTIADSIEPQRMSKSLTEKMQKLNCSYGKLLQVIRPMVEEFLERTQIYPAEWQRDISKSINFYATDGSDEIISYTDNQEKYDALRIIEAIEKLEKSRAQQTKL